MIKNQNKDLIPDEPPLVVRFQVRYNPTSTIPSVHRIRLNGRTICAAPDVTTTQKPETSSAYVSEIITQRIVTERATEKVTEKVTERVTERAPEIVTPTIIDQRYFYLINFRNHAAQVKVSITIFQSIVQFEVIGEKKTYGNLI